MSTTGLNSRPGLGRGLVHPGGGDHGERGGQGEPRPRGQRGEAGDGEQHRPARPPAAQREAAGHAGGADRLDRARPDRHGDAGGGGGAHRRVEPRQPVDGAEAGEHEQRHGHGGDRAGGDRHPLRLTGQLAGAGRREREGEHDPGAARAATQGGGTAGDRSREEEGARADFHEHPGILAHRERRDQCAGH